MYVGQGNWVKTLVINVNILTLSRLHGLSSRVNALRKYLKLTRDELYAHIYNVFVQKVVRQFSKIEKLNNIFRCWQIVIQ